jgi:type IV fimbrial biogenesis protein FimT
MYPSNKTKGFTLIELLVALAVLVIIVAFAAPSFVSLIENNRVTTQANTLLAAVNLARSEAVKQGLPASIQNETGGFGNGWCVIQGNLSATICPAASIVKRFPALNGVSVSVSPGGISGVTFDGRGYLAAPASAVRIELEPTGCATGANRMRVVSVSLSGQATVSLEACN